jgi:hypothetical protein
MYDIVLACLSRSVYAHSASVYVHNYFMYFQMDVSSVSAQLVMGLKLLGNWGVLWKEH